MIDRIDVNFDVRRDTPAGKDPDAYSHTLGLYHQFLWSRALPRGGLFRLDVTPPPVRLYHRSELGEFCLSSDGMIPSFRYMTSMIDQIPADEHDEFMRIGHTIGDFIIFPANRIDGRATINGTRGMHPLIRDRFDLTLECIRRFYAGEDFNPLGDVLDRYKRFFNLFVDFAGYVDFFLLQDLTNETASAINFFMPFDNFRSPPRPKTLDAYIAYRKLAIGFLTSRNRRIDTYSARIADRAPAR